MDNLLNFPKTTIVDKNVPKNAFYGRSEQKSWLKDLLSGEFESIRWLYKLTSVTVNVADGEKVHEIDVFLSRMKRDHYSINPFCGMDKLLPRHTMFIIEYGAHFDLLMHHKTMTIVKGEEKWACGVTELLRDVKFSELNLQLEGQTMDSIYGNLLGQISGLKTHREADYEQAAAERKEITQIQKQIEMLEKRCRSEKQTLKKYELHKLILNLKDFIK
jgi:hypothetical protein